MKSIHKRTRVGLWSMIVLFSLGGSSLSLACTDVGQRIAIQETPIMLVGKWQKMTSSDCSQAYPDQLNFSGQGLYNGQQQGTKKTFTLWDVGTYEITAPDQVKISIATDAVQPYKFTIASDIITFVDPSGCEFQYRRTK
jgi:hypothetical protein